MYRPAYDLARVVSRFIGGMAVRHVLVHGERLGRPGPFVLACTHIGHLEPLLLGGVMRRRIHWVARSEFYRRPSAAHALRRLGAIPVNRGGVPVRMVRDAVRCLDDGAIVGIFPEGGRTHGEDRVVVGGPIRGGAATIAMRAGVPIVPVVVLGIERMHAVTPWLPGQRTTVRTIVGEAILPDAAVTRRDRRSRRRTMTEALRQSFVALAAELEAATGGPA